VKKIMKYSKAALEQGLIPDGLIRIGIRGLLKDKLAEEKNKDLALGPNRIKDLVAELRESPVALYTKEANDQHYEVPTEFFQYVMGKHMKYSCGYWSGETQDIDASEEDMLRLSCERSELADGQDILELGCGWGSLTLYAARRYPRSRLVAVSNSRTQKAFIDEQARERGLKNITVITADMNEFEIDRRFDRVVSIEMFEHMRNYQKLLEKVASFLKEGGRLFVHIFTHRQYAYLYDEKDESDFIGRYFFTGGIMPSDDLLLNFQDHFQLRRHWQVEGTHYQKTSEAWLKNMDRHKQEILPIFKKTYGSDYRKWWIYWRVFFMSCAELWGYKKGTEWIVSHYLFEKKE